MRVPLGRSLALFAVLLVAACSGDKKKTPAIKTPCASNAHCTVPEVCASDNTCRSLCVQSRDCPNGEVCVVGTLAVCATSDEAADLEGKIAMPDAAVPPG